MTPSRCLVVARGERVAVDGPLAASSRMGATYNRTKVNVGKDDHLRVGIEDHLHVGLNNHLHVG
jgi:hypothetical protein